MNTNNNNNTNNTNNTKIVKYENTELISLYSQNKRYVNLLIKKERKFIVKMNFSEIYEI